MEKKIYIKRRNRSTRNTWMFWKVKRRIKKWNEFVCRFFLISSLSNKEHRKKKSASFFFFHCRCACVYVCIMVTFFGLVHVGKNAPTGLYTKKENKKKIGRKKRAEKKCFSSSAVYWCINAMWKGFVGTVCLKNEKNRVEFFFFCSDLVPPLWMGHNSIFLLHAITTAQIHFSTEKKKCFLHFRISVSLLLRFFFYIHFSYLLENFYMVFGCCKIETEKIQRVYPFYFDTRKQIPNQQQKKKM